MRLQFQRPVEVRAADQMAQVLPAGLVLGEQGQRVDPPAIFPRHPQEGARDRLDAVVAAACGKGDRAVEPVAVADGDGGKAAFLGQLGDSLGIDRPVEHRIAGEHPQGHERSMGHRRRLSRGARRDQAAWPGNLGIARENGCKIRQMWSYSRSTLANRRVMTWSIYPE